MLGARDLTIWGFSLVRLSFEPGSRGQIVRSLQRRLQGPMDALCLMCLGPLDAVFLRFVHRLSKDSGRSRPLDRPVPKQHVLNLKLFKQKNEACNLQATRRTTKEMVYPK